MHTRLQTLSRSCRQSLNYSFDDRNNSKVGMEAQQRSQNPGLWNFKPEKAIVERKRPIDLAFCRNIYDHKSQRYVSRSLIF